MKTVVGALTEVPEAKRDEYIEKEGKFVLKLEGDPHPEIAEARAKVVEFRDNNIALMKERETLTTKLKAFEGIDPAEVATLRTKITDLEKKVKPDAPDVEVRIRTAVADGIREVKDQLAEEKKHREEAETKLAKTSLENKLREVGVKLKVEEKAIPDFLARGLRVFGLDGIARDGDKELYSKDKPEQRLSMEDWAKDLFVEAPHLFTQSRGGDARGGPLGPGGKRTISSTDPAELGRLADKIAKGEIMVIPPQG